jgi:RND family efflux transporter MFP subunit
MDDRSALLNQLRIDRGAEPEGEGRPWLKWLLLAVVVLAAAAAAAYFLLPAPGTPVKTATARAAGGAGSAAASSLLDAAGYVVARRQATVSAKITGKVTEVLIEEGRRVEGGQVVARIDDTNVRAALNQAQAQLEAARAALTQIRVNLANAERDVSRKSSLAEQKLISTAELDTAQTNLDGLRAQLVTAQRNIDVAQRTVEVALRNLDDTVVRAPFSGVITVKAAQVGEIISPLSAGGGFTRTGIGTVVDMNSLEVEVDVSESFINRVHAEQAAVVKLNAYPDWEIPAYVIAIIPTAERSKATVKVRVGFKDKDRDPRILPEMGARVSFLSEAPAPGAAAATPGVVVPADAVLTSGNADTGAVFIVRGATVERRAVKLGAKTADGQTIVAGLAAGEVVALGALAGLQDGSKIKIEQP